MSEKKTTLKPTTKASKDLGEYARRAREVREKFAAEGRRFSDSAELVWAERGYREGRT